MLDNFKLNVIKELKEENQKLLNENFDLQCENNVLQEKIYRRDYEIKQLLKDFENFKTKYSTLEMKHTALKEYVTFIELEKSKLVEHFATLIGELDYLTDTIK